MTQAPITSTSTSFKMPASIQFTSTSPTKSPTTSIYTRPQKKQKMSITQTYFLAHSARGKLSKEASRPDHDLRLLVGHANMLDHLMIDLANAEQEQERWFNKSVSGAVESEEELSHQETIVEESEADWDVEEAESSDDESEYDEEEAKVQAATIVTTTTTEFDSESEDEDDEENYGDLALTRTTSRHSPPELSADSDSESEDEHMPLSPPTSTTDTFSEQQRQAIATTSFYDAKDTSLSPAEQETFAESGFFLPSRHQPAIIAAY